MRALEIEVVDAVWAAVEPLLPAPDRSHPLGCHRPRISDRVCFEAMLIRLVTGWSWVDAERLVGGTVSDTTLRAVNANRQVDEGAESVLGLVPARAWGFKSPIGQISKVSMNRFACPGVRGVSFSTFHRHWGEYRLVWHGTARHGTVPRVTCLWSLVPCRVDAAAPPESPRTQPNPYGL
jgi:hypothetical protein